MQRSWTSCGGGTWHSTRKDWITQIVHPAALGTSKKIVETFFDAAELHPASCLENIHRDPRIVHVDTASVSLSIDWTRKSLWITYAPLAAIRWILVDPKQRHLRMGTEEPIPQRFQEGIRTMWDMSWHLQLECPVH